MFSMHIFTHRIHVWDQSWFFLLCGSKIQWMQQCSITVTTLDSGFEIYYTKPLLAEHSLSVHLQFSFCSNFLSPKKVRSGVNIPHMQIPHHYHHPAKHTGDMIWNIHRSLRTCLKSKHVVHFIHWCPPLINTAFINQQKVLEYKSKHSSSFEMTWIPLCFGLKFCSDCGVNSIALGMVVKGQAAAVQLHD